MAWTSRQLILASASVVRARLLASAGIEFRTEPAELDEAAVKNDFRAGQHPAAACALALAEAKARWVSHRNPEALVIGADQILVCEGEWFDKPPNMDSARAQLQALRGRRHVLETAVCAIRAGERIWQHRSAPSLTMRQFSDTFLDAYLSAEGATVLHSVGAYRLEASGVQLFARIDGDYFSILGLPLLELLVFLREFGVIAV
jgi:nucleoside triphosphate pyrophosphatase